MTRTLVRGPGYVVCVGSLKNALKSSDEQQERKISRCRSGCRLDSTIQVNLLEIRCVVDWTLLFKWIF
jgi:hypothetical protein